MAAEFGQNSWNLLESYHEHRGGYSMCSNIVKLNDDEFILVHRSEIHKYNVIKNKWDIMHENDDQLRGTPCCIEYNPISNKLFVSDDDCIKIFELGVNTINYTKYETKIDQYSLFSSMIIINEECHIIGGENINSHYVWNMKTDINDKSQHIHTFQRISNRGWYSFGRVYIKRKNSLYCLGGFLSKNFQRTDEIRKYCLETSKWTLLTEKLVYAVNYCGVAVGKDERYILIMGGYDNSYHTKYMDVIQIFDINTDKTYISNIKLPFKGACKCIIMEDENKNELLINGFIRKYCINNNMNIPSVLIEFMMIWHSIEFVHVIHPHNNAIHFKISLDIIINNIS